MKKRSQLADHLFRADSQVRYDAACKKILSAKSFPAVLIHDCIPCFSEYSPEEIRCRYIEGSRKYQNIPVHPDDVAPSISGINTENAQIQGSKSVYDILFRLMLPKEESEPEMFIHIEAQGTTPPERVLVNRMEYYAAGLIQFQYGRVFKKMDYKKMARVCSIWIMMNPPRNKQNSVNLYQRTEIPVNGKPENINCNRINIIKINLGNPDEPGLLPSLRMMDILFSETMDPELKMELLEDEFGIEMTEEIGEEVVEMCTFSQGLIEKGVEKGVKI